ncbi:hypothetical protein PTSG_04539 [Salpingoeca rosetta]|uniref:Chorein N-terminal domain-containing protein n=1 Tax=Salpingoeca rosetta (strain ATCC 50818 / BSB-021) TaxID=946362 RepID=F2U7Q7_SALR5|nr:uncharacterized protein PTSG_04539 [Salpingoeca rosetta]EGD72812.1 hypothetical protein PTSG_04539 [Salpingoeca rosetta]|eukprot:XP_004994635.1 hypothetical protein PTSG_04539 [Salpingoeca rosetta]
MLEQYVQRVVAGYLEDYVTNFDASQLNLSFWHGKATLANLNLNTAVLQETLELPPCLRLAHGRVGRLIIEIPWTRIGSEPVVVTLEDVHCTLMSIDADAAVSAATFTHLLSSHPARAPDAPSSPAARSTPPSSPSLSASSRRGSPRRGSATQTATSPRGASSSPHSSSSSSSSSASSRRCRANPLRPASARLPLGTCKT